jgi:hypothetical protein
VVPERHRVELERREELELGRPQRRVEVAVPEEEVAGVEEDRVRLRGAQRRDHGGRLDEPADGAVEVVVLGTDRVEVRVRVSDVQDGERNVLGGVGHPEQEHHRERCAGNRP